MSDDSTATEGESEHGPESGDEAEKPDGGRVLSLTDFIDQLERRAFMRSLESRPAGAWHRNSWDSESEL